jgi:hypothetical protein
MYSINSNDRNGSMTYGSPAYPIGAPQRGAAPGSVFYNRSVFFIIFQRYRAWGCNCCRAKTPQEGP